MKTKDLVYIGIIGYLAYLILKKKPNLTVSDSTTNLNIPPVGNATNGGLNLGTNMDLPNLTPTPSDGLSTETALSDSNITPLIKEDNEPTQIFGGVTLPTPYYSTSVVNINPIDTVPVPETPTSPIIAEPITSTGSIPTPIDTGASLVSEPVFPIKTISAQLITNEPSLSESMSVAEDVKSEIVSECGNSFSIPNYDKEGSYTNFWIDGNSYYTQTTSPLIKTIPTKITKDAFFDGCKRFKLVLTKNSKL